MTESAPGIIFSGSGFFFRSRSPNEWFSWKPKPPEATRERKRGRVMPPSYGADRKHPAREEPSQWGSWRSGRVEWGEGRKKMMQNTLGNRQEVELSRSRFKKTTRLTILFWQFLPIGDRWVITKTKQYSSIQLTLKCSGTVMLVDCWKLEYKTIKLIYDPITLALIVISGVQLCNTALTFFFMQLFTKCRYAVAQFVQ